MSYSIAIRAEGAVKYRTLDGMLKPLTVHINNAKQFATREEADKACVGDEYVVEHKPRHYPWSWRK